MTRLGPALAVLFLAGPFLIGPLLAGPLLVADPVAYAVTIDGVEAKVTPGVSGKVTVAGKELEVVLSAPQGTGEVIAFDLTIAGESFGVVLGRTSQTKSTREEGRTFTILVEHWHPTYRMGPIHFRYPEGASVIDDRDPENRMATVTFEDDEISVMDGRPSTSAESLLQQILLATKAEFAGDSDWTNVQSSNAEAVRFRKSGGWRGHVSAVDEDGDTYFSGVMVLESNAAPIVLLYAYWEGQERALMRKFAMVIDSVEFVPTKKEPGKRDVPDTNTPEKDTKTQESAPGS